MAGASLESLPKSGRSTIARPDTSCRGSTQRRRASQRSGAGFDGSNSSCRRHRMPISRPNGATFEPTSLGESLIAIYRFDACRRRRSEDRPLSARRAPVSTKTRRIAKSRLSSKASQRSHTLEVPAARRRGGSAGELLEFRAACAPSVTR